MSALNQEKIKKIANMLPPELGREFYSLMMTLPNLPAHDEMLQILELLQFFMIVAEQVPGLMTEEREKLERLCAEFIKNARELETSGKDCYKNLYSRLVALPAEILEGLDPKAFAAQISDNLVTQFVNSGIPKTASILVKSAKAFETVTTDHKQAFEKLCDSWNSATAKTQTAIGGIHKATEEAEAKVSTFLVKLESGTSHAMDMLTIRTRKLFWLSLVPILATMLNVGTIIYLLKTLHELKTTISIFEERNLYFQEILLRQKNLRE